MPDEYINLDIDKAEEWFFPLLGKSIEVTNIKIYWYKKDYLTGIDYLIGAPSIKGELGKYFYARIKKSDYDKYLREYAEDQKEMTEPKYSEKQIWNGALMFNFSDGFEWVRCSSINYIGRYMYVVRDVYHDFSFDELQTMTIVPEPPECK